jgi:hypothetical protein
MLERCSNIVTEKADHLEVANSEWKEVVIFYGECET